MFPESKGLFSFSFYEDFFFLVSITLVVFLIEKNVVILSYIFPKNMFSNQSKENKKQSISNSLKLNLHNGYFLQLF